MRIWKMNGYTEMGGGMKFEARFKRKKKGKWQIGGGQAWESGTHKREKSKERGETGAEDADKLGREEASSQIYGQKKKICQNRKASEKKRRERIQT